MITKKIVAISCLFLALPVCPMRREARVGAQASKLALTRAAYTRTRHSFINSRRLSTVVLSNKRKTRKNRTFVFSGMPINLGTKRFLCTEKEEKNEQKIIDKYSKLKKRVDGCLLTKICAFYPALISGCVLPAAILKGGGLEVLVDGVNAANGCAGVFTASLGAVFIAHAREKCFKKKAEGLELQFSFIPKKIEEEKSKKRLESRELFKETVEFPYAWTSNALCNAMLERDKKLVRSGLRSIATERACLGLITCSLLAFGYNVILIVDDPYWIHDHEAKAFLSLISSGVVFGIGAAVLSGERFIERSIQQDVQDKLDLAELKDWRLYDRAIEKYNRIQNSQRRGQLERQYGMNRAGEGMRRYKELYNIKD